MTRDLQDPPRAVLDILTRAANDRKSPWRWPVLATRGASYPGARMLVVRAFDRLERTVELHSDARSAKCSELVQDPACALLFFDRASMIQLRVDGRAQLLTGAAAAPSFARAGSLDDFRGRAPGDDPDAPASPESDNARATFAAIRIRIERADLLSISRDGHERRFVDFTRTPPAWRRAAP